MLQFRRILKVTLIVLCVLFIGLQIFHLEIQAAGIRALLLILLSTLYWVKVQPKNIFFIIFLMLFTIGELVTFASFFKDSNLDSINYFYYSGNILYIMAYIMLILRVIKDVDLMQVLSRFWFHIVILVILDIFCVVIVSGAAKNYLSQSQYFLEFIYNSVIMILLSVAMINYLLKNSQKSMNMLLGSIFIFFSEVIQLTYFYISDLNILNVVCSLFLVLAFLFFYLQSRTSTEVEQNSIRLDLYT